MLKKLIFFLFIINSFALEFEFNTLQCDFVQTVTTAKKKSVTYSGTLFAKKPDKALWIYKKPVEKEVYIGAKEVVVYEPQLEQASVQNKRNAFGIEEVLKNARQIEKDKYTAKVDDTIVTIIKKGDTVESLSYTDKLDNNVEIRLLNQKKNQFIDDKIFIFTPKAGVDIVRR